MKLNYYICAINFGITIKNRLMRKILFTLTMLLACCCLQALAQDISISSKVVDAKSQESVPFAQIFISPEHTTLGNEDGHFSIQAHLRDTLRISCIGYETIRIIAAEVKDEICLTPVSTQLGEVTVRTSGSILDRVAKRMKAMYKKGKKEESQYFCRTTAKIKDRHELLEAFIAAKSAVCLRNLSILGGRRMKLDDYTDTKASLSQANLHHMLELGPMMKDALFWTDIDAPLDGRNYKRFYDATHEQYTDSSGHTTYIIHLKRKRLIGDRRVFECTLYVDAGTYDVIRYVGHTPPMQILVRDREMMDAINVMGNFCIDYRYDKGFAEIQAIQYKIEGEDFLGKSVLFNVNNMVSLPEKKDRKEMGENMAQAIDEAGFDSTLWANSGIIQRTMEEERIAFGHSTSVEVKKLMRPAPDTCAVAAASLTQLRDRLYTFGNNTPQEKIFVHMDNTCYFQGDTIWFATYTRSTDYGAPSRLSKVLYVELLNNDGYLVERKLIEMHNGRGNGFFSLDKPIQYSGFYELRAYTRWQLNWGEFEHPHSRYAKRWFLSKWLRSNFYRDYEKLYSRVFPVYDKPAKEGSFEHKMTLRTMRRYFRKDPDKRKLAISFFPEGGNLVAGIPCRVAFEAAWDDGQWTEGLLYIGNDSVPVTNRGRGVFTFTPQQGKRQQVQFRTLDGKNIKADLPKPEDMGVALQLLHEADSTSVINLQMTADLVPDSMAITVMHEGCLEYFRPLNGRTCTFSIPHRNLPAGVHQVSVFDTEGKVWADRLFFVRKQDLSQPSLKISGTQAEFAPYQKIELGIMATDTTKAGKWERISIAVRDELHADKTFDNGSILTEMLLASEVKGFIPNPGWFFEEDDSIRREALDLLMMTQGWRRFDWQQMALPGMWKEKHPIEKTQMLEGMVYKTSEWKHYKQEFFRDEHGRTPTATEIQKRRIQTLADAPLKMSEPETIGYEKEEKEFLEVDADASGFILSGNPKNEAIVQMEMMQPGVINRYAKDDQETKNGKFFLTMPRYHGECVLFIDATDKKKWKRNKHFSLTQTEEEFNERMPLKRRRRIKENPSSFHITMNFPYPRFVKPYNFYQKHLRDSYHKNNMSRSLLADGTNLMGEVEVRSRFNGLRQFDDSQPLFVLDAYDAYNAAYDAGMLPNDEKSIAHMIVGDMGLERPFTRIMTPTIDEDGKSLDGPPPFDDRINIRYGMDANMRLHRGLTVHPDSIYLRQNLASLPIWVSGSEHSGWVAQKNHVLSPSQKLEISTWGGRDKIVVYSDYQPRLEGDERYKLSNIPSVDIVIYPFMDGSTRLFYKARRFVLPGFSAPVQYYSPDYSKQTPPDSVKDYRRTLYWNPNLMLDKDGKATITLYNNARTTQISVDAAGQAADGTLLWGEER